MKAVVLENKFGGGLTIRQSSKRPDRVYLNATEECDGVIFAASVPLTPAQARRVAKALMKFAEGAKHG